MDDIPEKLPVEDIDDYDWDEADTRQRQLAEKKGKLKNILFFLFVLFLSVSAPIALNPIIFSIFLFLMQFFRSF